MPLESEKKQMDELYAQFQKDFDDFNNRGVKAAAGRSRKALMEMCKLGKVMRASIQDKKSKM